MKYDYCDDLNKENVITSPLTPVTGVDINTLKFGGMGWRLIREDDPILNRVVKVTAQSSFSDFKGETLYLSGKNIEIDSLVIPIAKTGETIMVTVTLG